MGETWYRGSGHMPEELCQVCCKSHYGSLALHCDPSPYVIYFDEKRLRIKRIKHAGGNMLMSKKVQYLITGGEGGMERDAWIREEVQPCHRFPRKNVHFFVFPKDCFIILQ